MDLIVSLPLVFISYTSKDSDGKRFAIELQRILIGNGYDVFVFDHLKKEHLGAELWYLLTDEIVNRQVVVVLCTRDINKSRGARFEISHALERNKLIVPLKFGDAPVPDPIAIYVREHFDESNYRSVFTSIAMGLPKSYEDHLQRIDRMEQERESFRRRPPTEPRIVPTPEGGDQLLSSIVKGYHRNSVVEQVSVLENFDFSLHSALTFGHIGLRVPIDRDWIGNPSHYVIVDDFGKSVAWGERNYLRDLWCGYIRTEIIPLSRFTFQEFAEILKEMSSGMSPKALFAPIGMYVKFMSVVRNAPFGKWPIRWEDGKSFYLLEDGRELRMFWSNKYAPLDHFVLVDPSATRWCVKPDRNSGDRLTAVFVENERDPKMKIDFLVETVVSAQLVDPNGIRLFKFE